MLVVLVMGGRGNRGFGRRWIEVGFLGFDTYIAERGVLGSDDGLRRDCGHEERENYSVVYKRVSSYGVRSSFPHGPLKCSSLCIQLECNLTNGFRFIIYP